MDLTVCIVSWDACELTLSCLRSLFDSAAGFEYETIVVDNGSTDGTDQSIRERFPCVAVIANPRNLGFAKAMNQAIREAGGRYVLLLNNDTAVRPHALGNMMDFMDRNPDIGALGCRLRLAGGEIQHSAHSDRTWWDFLFRSLFLDRVFPHSRILGRVNMTWMDYESVRVKDVDWMAAAALMVRAEAIERSGLLDERIFAFSEDWEWCIRLKRNGWRVVYFSGAEIVHLHGMSSHSPESTKDARIREWSILTMAASLEYVYRKLHPDHRLRVFLFTLCRRLFSLSRCLAHSLRYLFKRQPPDRDLARAFLRATFTSTRSLNSGFLNPGGDWTGAPGQDSP